MLRPVLGGLAALAALAFAGPAFAVVMSGDLPVIDSFERTVFVSEPAFIALNSITQTAPAGAVGDRRVSISATEGRNNALYIARGKAFFRSMGEDTVFRIDYGVSQPLDLELPGAAFKFDVLESDLDDRALSAPFDTTLTSGEGVVETVRIALSGEGEMIIPFARFRLTDFTDIDYITFSFDTTGIPHSRVVIGPIIDPALPEPATATLFGVGLLALAGAFRKRARRLPAA